MGIVGCVTCIVGSVVIVIHAPQEHSLNSVEEILGPGDPNRFVNRDLYLVLLSFNATCHKTFIGLFNWTCFSFLHSLSDLCCSYNFPSVSFGLAF